MEAPSATSPAPLAAAPDTRVPVHVISGFLGAGKTTLLRHILTNKDDMQIGVVVNDMAASNIDAKLTRTTNVTGADGSEQIFDPSNSVELDNGCVCCSLSDELIQVVSKLVALGKQRGRMFDRIIVECTGVAEPKAVAESFEEAEEEGMPLFSEIKFQNIITVVDSGTFVRDFQSKHLVDERPDIADGEGAGEGRHVVDLLVEQVEAANTIVLNKADRLKPDQMERLEATIGTLNQKANIVHAEYGMVTPLSTLFDSGKIASNAPIGHGGEHGEAHGVAHGDHGIAAHGDHGIAHGHGDTDGYSEEGAGHGGHVDVHGHGHGADTKQTFKDKFNISSFTYNRRKPFDPTRLQVFLQGMPADVGRCVVPVGSELTGKVTELKKLLRPVIRSKGFCWLTSQPKTALYWAHAGSFYELQTEGAWWADVPEEHMPNDESSRNKVLADFQEPFGDRRQEIVFIGIGMKQELMEAALDECLLTDEEMAAYVEKNPLTRKA